MKSLNIVYKADTEEIALAHFHSLKINGKIFMIP